MNDDSLADTVQAKTLDLKRPINFRTGANFHQNVEAFEANGIIYARIPTQAGWFAFDHSGAAVSPTWRGWSLEQAKPTPRKYTQKIALIEWRGVVYPHGISEYVENFGIDKYFKTQVAGKLLAIKTVTFTENEGLL